MAEIIRFQLRRDTSANWALYNPVLADGEPGIERETGLQKVGDGTRPWNSLPYNTAGWQGVLDAKAAREGALASEESAAADASLAELYRGDAQTARTAAETARSAAQTARSGAETARSGAETALSGATTARQGAEAARDAAGAFHSTTVQSGSVVNGQLVLRKNDNTTQVAGDVRGPALVGTVIDTVTGPETPGATGAPGLKGDKGDPGGIVLGTDLGANNLNDITAPGVYRKGGAPADGMNYPVLDLGVLIVHQSSTAPWVVQEYQVTATLAGSRARVFYRRVLTSGTWSAWQAYTSTRTDQAAGRAIYQWDEVNNREQLIYGDTGWRDVSGLLVNSWSASPAIYLRRQGTLVTLVGAINGSTATNDHFLSLLNDPGFRPSSVSIFSPVVSGDYTLFRDLQFDAAGAVMQVYVRSAPVGKDWRIGASWHTASAWPTTLPGTASGAIPNT